MTWASDDIGEIIRWFRERREKKREVYMKALQAEYEYYHNKKKKKKKKKKGKKKK